MIDHQAQYPASVIRDTNPANFLRDGAGNVIPNSGPISQVNRSYVNQGSTEVQGIDFEIAMRNSLEEAGKLNTKLAVSHQLVYKRAERPGEATANVVGANGGLSDWATSVGDIPRTRINLSTAWTVGAHTLSGNVDFVSQISLLRRSDNDVTYPVPYCYYGVGQPSTAYQLGGLPKYSNYYPFSCEVASLTTVGASYAYNGIKNMTLSLNIRNLFDTKAPYDPRYPTTGFNTQLHTGEGRYFSVSANYKFW